MIIDSLSSPAAAGTAPRVATAPAQVHTLPPRRAVASVGCTLTGTGCVTYSAIPAGTLTSGAVQAYNPEPRHDHGDGRHLVSDHRGRRVPPQQ